MASTSFVTALRRLPPSTIARVHSFLPAQTWLPIRQYATPARRSDPSSSHDALPTSLHDTSDLSAVVTASRPRRLRKSLHVDMDLREFDNIRGVQEALRTGHHEDAVRLAVDYVDRIALDLAKTLPSELEGTSARALEPQAVRDKIYPLLGVFLDASDRPELYTRVLRRCVEMECLRLDPNQRGERHVGHIGLLAGTALRTSNQSWLDNLGMFVQIPRSVLDSNGRETYHDLSSKVIAALLGDRRFINRTTAIHQLFSTELNSAGIDCSKHWSFLPWVMIVHRLRRYRHVLALQQNFVAHLDHIRASQPGRVWTTEETSAIVKVYESVLRSWVDAQSHSETRSPVVVGSPVPYQLTQQLVNTLGSRDKLSTSYITQWMTCERLAQRYEVAKLAWDTFDLSPCPSPIDKFLISQMDPDYRVDSRPRPDIKAWEEYFTLRRALPRANETEPRLQEMLRRMYDTISIASFTTSSLNEILALFAHGSQFDHGLLDPQENLPMLLFILQRYDYDPTQEFGPAPNARTINLAGAALVNLWGSSGQYFDPVFGLHAARMARKSVETRNKGSLLVDEWSMLNVAVRDLLPEDETGVDVDLPLRKPPTPKGAHMRPSEQRLIDFDDLEDIDMVEAPPVPPAHILLRPMMYLVEKAIKLVLSERHETEAEVDVAFQALMDRVYSRILPQSHGWVQTHGDVQAGEWTILREDQSGAAETETGERYLVDEPEDVDDAD